MEFRHLSPGQRPNHSSHGSNTSLRRSETDSLLSSRSTPQALLPTIRQHPKVAWATVGLASVFLLGGYDSVIVTTVPSVPQFQKDFGERYDNRHIIPSMWLSLWSALPCVGNIAGALMAGWAQDRFGRRWPFAIGSVLSAVAVAIACLSPLSADIDTRRSVFLLAEIVQGFALGLAQTTAQTYMSEAVPTAMRAPAMALIPTLALIGQLIGAVVVFLGSAKTSRSAYVVAFHSMWPFSAVPIIVALLIPESPVHLLRQQDLIGTLCSLRKLYTESTDCDQLFKNLQHHVSQEDREERSSYGDCFRESNRRRTLIVIFASMVPTLFGLNLLSDSSYFLQMVGMKAKESLIMLVLGIALALVANALGVWVSSQVGRRTLILTSIAITTVLWLAVGIVGCWSGDFVPWYTAASLMVIIVVCSVGAWPASYTVISEVSSLRLRAKSMGVSIVTRSVVGIVFSLVLPYLYNRDAADLRAKLGFVYFGLCVLALAGTWWGVPEMKGRSSVEIDYMFKLRVPARKFGSLVQGKQTG
ncbi:MFS general substrate transporter [Aspergillus campestris IBT 28561]|uniref:MFS general substrate transporter n=1 Tax=Aspergillus campestris (strain IBT 28561) TaxID=1392248 RepID=A0A2I1CRA5_ASPC2|nr:MFS general substrate transporter [Aspergillus campestris IBT 28561]PKY00145.1 MFS general substrate transporter [Aspergillus campestris IBT 28561]